MSEHAVPDAHSAHGAHHVNYWAIGAVLAVLTGVSWIVDEFSGQKPHHTAGEHAAAEHVVSAKPAGGFSMKMVVVLIVMAVAVAKATCVMAYFMHVKFEGRWIYAMLLPTIVLACAIPAALLPDIGIHYYLVQTFQTDERDAQLAAESEPPHSHPEAAEPTHSAPAKP